MDKLIKKWRVENPKSKTVFEVELWEKPDGKTYKVFKRLR